MFDLDKFKDINDRFGHHVGDQVLISFCKVVAASLRPEELFVRLGGEEFALLLSASLDEALQVAERIRANLQATMLEVEGNILAVTVSVGVAISANHKDDLASVLRAADRALYVAKANGRNRIEHASSVPEIHVEDVKTDRRRLLAAARRP
jgi:diguanylate cyclase (GGDEF)-like protein